MKVGSISCISRGFLLSMALSLFLFAAPVFASETKAVKPSPDEIIAKLKQGNQRFVSGKAVHPNSDAARLAQAGRESQAVHAIATVLSCSDSRVPVELIFDAGVMDLFVVRVAGNVVNGDEAGSIEYGLAHVNTPVLVVMGHSQCGAVTAVTEAIGGHGHALEVNIPPLVGSIQPAVKRAMEENPQLEGKAVVPAAIVENVWQSITDLFMKSPAVREMVKEGKVKVVGVIYDVATGKVEWLEDKAGAILAKVEKNPKRQMKKMAGETGKKEKAH